jgi:signal transduction histidine kinase
LDGQDAHSDSTSVALTLLDTPRDRAGDCVDILSDRGLTPRHNSLKKGEQERARLDINNLVREVMTLVQGDLKNRGVSSRAELADDLPRVLADRIQLRQVILNLIINAIEAMVSVSGRARVLRVRSENHGHNGVRVAVEDSGSGIPQEDMDRIFETFFTTKSEGMGMGLSICRSIVASHGGRITVAKGVPQGSVFQLILPGDRT